MTETPESTGQPQYGDRPDAPSRLGQVTAWTVIIAGVVFGYFVLPETLARDKRRAFTFKRANPLGALVAFRHHPLVLGFEISGTVSKLGPNVSGLKVGDRVATFVEKGGGYAQKAVAPANIVMRLPDSVSFEVGAALPIQPLTGYHMLYTAHGLKPGEIVLINAIGGAGDFTTLAISRFFVALECGKHDPGL